MPAPTPDPVDRPSSAKRAEGAGSSGAAEPTIGSTGSHRQPGAGASLSELLRGNSSSSRRPPNAADLAAHLAGPAGTATPGPPPRADSDDAPTVITQHGRTPPAARPAAPPPPPYVVGDVPSVAGRRLGHFELIEAIGAGGMAAVLKARDLELGRIVALKILPPESTNDAENVTRFKQEARAAAKLDHDNVARVYFCGEDQGLHFIAFEFVEGVTLRSLIDRRGPLPAGECVRYMLQVAAGLNHAAERGVVHRDIKPSNIVITPDGRAKIVDMGLARHLESQSVNGGVTQSGVTLGTFDYISPEQALDPRRADVRSDIYSLGCAFYHALTGRPPVPEGTAAKKLYAHQHVDPLDPRELNPAIPDEVAAVLARMMAKNPDRRYQTPTALIAHLKAVAERLRLSPDAVVSDSAVRAVPAGSRVLPELPRLRLGWVAGAAAVVIAAVVIAVTATGPGPVPSPPPWPTLPGPGKKDDSQAVVDPKTNPVPFGPQAAADGDVVSTAEGLATRLADPNTKKVHLAPVKFDLTRLDKPVIFQGPEIELVGSVGRTEIRVAAPPGQPVTPPRTGTLTLKAESVAVRGIRFDIAPPSLPGPEETTGLLEGGPAAVSGLTIETGRLELTDCTFVPDEQALRKGLSTVGVTAQTAESGVHVRVERCLFAPGGVGLRVPTRADVTVEDCGFGPHASAIQVRGDKPPDPSAESGPPSPETPPQVYTVRLDRSSFMLDPNSAAVGVDPPAGVEVRVGYCVFAPASGAVLEPKAFGPPITPRRGAIVRVTGDKVHGVRLAAAKDRKNAYYGGVDPVATAVREYTFDQWKDLSIPADDTGWVKLERRPWDTTGSVLAALGTADPWRAFRLRITGEAADPDLFVAKGDPVRVVGAQFHDPRENTRGAYPGIVWPPPDPAAAANVKQKVWWPGGPATDLKPGVYTNLVKLLQDARSGDTILIRHTGLLVVPQHLIQLPRPGTGADRGEFRLTFKADGNETPVLTPDAVKTLDLSLFRVVEGLVRFEGLHFLLRPGASQDSLAAVTLVAGKGCTFQNCTFTLAEGDEQVAAVVALADPGREMKMDGPAARTAPKIEFEGCLIRGKGRGILLPASRPFDLRMEQCITALNGPVVYVKAADRDPGSATPSTVRLSRVTALLGGPLVELHAGKLGQMRASGLVPTTVTADGCLFAAVPGAGRPIIEVVGTELDRTDRNGVLRWGGGDHPNRFANFDPTAPAAVVRPDDDSTHSWNWNEWIGFARELGRPVGKVTFDRPGALKDLATLKPADAAVRAVDFPDLTGPKPDDAGADPGKVARPPDDETRPE
ncbi:MAG: hypothetical protein JWO38_3379 [Gemmataceae bacterium]|nr:hypothetical protein [Gemmataceae bacterium]